MEYVEGIVEKLKNLLSPTKPPTEKPLSQETPREFLRVEIAKTIIPKENQTEEKSGDQIYEINNGAILLDGAGGMGDDSYAAKRAGFTISEVFNRLEPNFPDSSIQIGDTGGVIKAIIQSFREAATVLRVAKEHKKMVETADTTANMVVIVNTKEGPVLVSANVGDSTTLLRNDKSGNLEVISEEHSVVANLVATGQITKEQALTHPRRNEVYRFVGSIKPESNDDQIAGLIALKITPISPSHSVLVMSDGITDNFRPEHIEDISRRFAKERKSSSQLSHYLVEQARVLSKQPLNPMAKPDDISCVSITPVGAS